MTNPIDARESVCRDCGLSSPQYLCPRDRDYKPRCYSCNQSHLIDSRHTPPMVRFKHEPKDVLTCPLDEVMLSYTGVDHMYYCVLCERVYEIDV